MAGTRTISTKLMLNVQDFKNGAKQASSSLDELVKKGDKTQRVSQYGLGRLEQSIRLQRGAWDTASTAMLGWGAAGVLATGMVVKTFADFDEAMSNVQAATHESAGNMDLLRDAAIDAGAETVFSATEAAGAIEELAKAGVSTADILGGGLAGALDLAAAGGLGVAEAAEIASVAMTQFKLSGDQIPHLADLLAAGAGKAMGDVTDLGMALKQAGLVASATGLSIEETTGGLSAFAAAGLLGSDAGTSFKSMLQRLTPQSANARETMEELGISAYDAQGNFIGLSAFAGNLHDAMKNLTPEARNAAMSVMFGSDAVRAANVLYENGQAGIQGWIDAVDDSGYAAETAAARMDNLKGDWEGFTGSLETLVLNSGSGLNEFLRGLVQGAEGLVDLLGKIPAPVLNTVAAIGGLGAVSMVGAGGLMKLTTSAYDTYTAFKSLTATAPRLATGLKMLGGISMAGLTIGATVIGALIADFAEANAAAEEFAGTLDKTTGAMTEMSNEWAANKLVESGAADALKQLGYDVGESAKIALEGGEAWKQLQNELLHTSGQAAFTAAEGLADLNIASEEGAKKAALYRETLAGVDESQGEVAGSASDAADGLVPVSDALRGTGEAAEAAKEQIDEYVDSLSAAAGIFMDTDEAQAAWAQQTRDNAKALEELSGYTNEAGDWVEGLGTAVVEGGGAWDLYSDAGQLANATMIDTSKKAWDVVEALYAEQGASADLEGAMQSGRDEFVKTAMQMGLNEQAANDLADDYGLIPGTVRTEILAIDNATGVIAGVERQLDYLDGKTANTYLYNHTIETFGGTPGRGKQVQADGGILHGISQTFAFGGMRLPSAATIQSPVGVDGLVQWAEKSTGGEAFIPMTPAKRGRSELILAEVARRFGGAYVKSFADGAINTRSAPATSYAAPSAAAPVVNVDLDGLSVTGRFEIGRDGLATLVDGRIQQWLPKGGY